MFKKLLIRNIMITSLHRWNRRGNSKKITRIRWLKDVLTRWPKLRKDRGEWKRILRKFTPKRFKDKCIQRSNRWKRAGLRSNYSVNKWINMPRCSEIETCWLKIRGWIFWIRDKTSMHNTCLGQITNKGHETKKIFRKINNQINWS